MGSGLDAKHFVHLPGWAKALCLLMLGVGIAASIAIMLHFFGTAENRDWVLIGISGVQFLITAFVIAVILFLSQTDANIATLQDRAETFLDDILPKALGRITLDDEPGTGVTVLQGDRRDIFGYHYDLMQGDTRALRLWCGVNVRRLIVIYRFVDATANRDPVAFEARIRDVFRFTFGGATSVKYNPPHVEPLPGEALPTGKETQRPVAASVWLTADLPNEFLTDPAAKLFWSQDIAMMTESLLRTALRQSEVLLDTQSRPRPQ